MQTIYNRAKIASFLKCKLRPLPFGFLEALTLFCIDDNRYISFLYHYDEHYDEEQLEESVFHLTTYRPF